MKQSKLLIVDDNKDVLFALELMLRSHVGELKSIANPELLPESIHSFKPNVILLDMNFKQDTSSGNEGIYWLSRIKAIDASISIIFITAHADMDKAIKALKAGAMDFIPKPWEKEKLIATIKAACELSASKQKASKLEQQKETLTTPPKPDEELIGESSAMQELTTLIERIANTDANVLILGENGTGKDVVARILHRRSQRSSKPFVSIDLGSIAEGLFESELFGYEQGAFTDAKKAKAGRVEIASSGTLFLDEIGNLSLAMQSRLLTLIERRELTRLGAVNATSIDVRLICATNQDIPQMVNNGQFRQDLLYRINTLELHIPPLRQRGNDVILLAEHFLCKYSRKYRKTIKGFSNKAKNKLTAYDWPGNVRELQHVVERIVLLCDTDIIRDDIVQLSSGKTLTYTRTEDLNLETLEKQTIEQAIEQTNGNLTQAAKLLGITRFALYRKIEKLNI